MIPCPAYVNIILFEVSTGCNLSCQGCDRTINNGKNKSRYMRVKDFRTILDNCPPTKTINFGGLGEPTLNPVLGEIIAVAKASGKAGSIHLISNGLAKDASFYQDLESKGLDGLLLSIDSLSPDIAKTIRSGTDVVELLNKVKALREALNIPIRVNITLSKLNQHDFINTLEKLDSIGNIGVMLSEYMDFGLPEPHLSTKEKEQLLLKLKCTAFKNISISLPQYALPPGGLCDQPVSRIIVTVDGYMTPCCSTYDPSVYHYTSLKEYSYSEAWQQPGVAGWLADYVNGKKTKFCESCILNPKECLDLGRKLGFWQ